MLADKISPSSIATWSTIQYFYTDLTVEVDMPVVHHRISSSSSDLTELNAPLLLETAYNTFYNNNKKAYEYSGSSSKDDAGQHTTTITSMLFDLNETSAYRIILNGTSGDITTSGDHNNIFLGYGNLDGSGGNNDGFNLFNGTLGGDVEYNEFDDQKRALDDFFIGRGASGGGVGVGVGDVGVAVGIAGNSTLMRDPTVALAKIIVMSVLLGLLIFITIIGNVFVIAAIILERNLQNVANYLVVSLAVADLLVACLVMPLGAVYEISEGWILGPELCDIWTSCDVLCCTASILHLVAIAADRYWTVTNIDYSNVRTPSRVFGMIFCVWFTAVIISLAPQFGWKDPEYLQRIEEQKCMVSQDVAYQIFATCCTFYVPLLVILALYWKIYKIARKRIQRRIQQRPISMAPNQNQNQKCSNATAERQRKRLKICFGKTERNSIAGGSVTTNNTSMETNVGNSLSISNMREETEYSTSNFDSKSHATEVTTASGEAEESQISAIGEISTVSQEVASTARQQQAIAITITTSAQQLAAVGGGAFPTAASVQGGGTTSTTANTQNAQTNKLLTSIANPYHKLNKRRQMLEAKRERKAAQTLAIITGAFAICWLPFFVMALLLSLCKECHINAVLASLFLWLGYFNSTLNPIIYTIFNPEFRRAFQRILCGRKRGSLRGPGRSGKI